MKALDKFKFHGRGVWSGVAGRIVLYDSSKTFRAFRLRNGVSEVVCNPNGNAVRFRSAEAAAEYLEQSKALSDRVKRSDM